MNKKQRTSIDNLAIAGFELSEEHMSLASGGLPMRTANRQGPARSPRTDSAGGGSVGSVVSFPPPLPPLSVSS